jgi:hypothetical protein
VTERRRSERLERELEVRGAVVVVVIIISIIISMILLLLLLLLPLITLLIIIIKDCMQHQVDGGLVCSTKSFALIQVARRSGQSECFPNPLLSTRRVTWTST